DELPRRVGLDHFPVDDHLGHAHRLHLLGGERLVRAARTQLVFRDSVVTRSRSPSGAEVR
ncbi:MAG: hypothetical protein ACXW0R_12845, partial [Gaiellaceae bacterium]